MLKCLAKQGFQCLPFPYSSETSATQASFVEAKTYKKGKDRHKGSSPCLKPLLSVKTQCWTLFWDGSFH